MSTNCARCGAELLDRRHAENNDYHWSCWEGEKEDRERQRQEADARHVPGCHWDGARLVLDDPNLYQRHLDREHEKTEKP